MSAQVARMCGRCRRFQLRWLGDTVRDALGYVFWVCMDCRERDDRPVRP